jgi:methylamine dehydrogenase accessory protein MauD
VTLEAIVLTLLAILTIANAIALIAIARQVGLLQIRLAPIPALTSDSGPSPGDRFVLPDDLAATWQPTRSTTVYVAISPTCSLCEPLLPGLKALSNAWNDELTIALLSDAQADELQTYKETKRITLPILRHPEVMTMNGISGVPFAIVANRDGLIRAAGGINSLEQLEMLLDTADNVPRDEMAVSVEETHRARATTSIEG